MSKLDPGLKFLLAATNAELPDIAADSVFGVEAIPEQPARVNVLVEFHGDIARLVDAGLAVRARADAVVTGDIEIARVPELEAVDGLVRAEVSRTLDPELDHALPDARVSPLHVWTTPLLGAGVIVGIIDTGIDYQHPAFRRADGSTRILAIWDQSLQPQPLENSPGAFAYGVEYRQADIDTALGSVAPLTVVRHQDLHGFHGTHVAGIAAGNGQPVPIGANPRFVGVAPEAELIVVANTRGRAQNERGLGDSADTLDAVQYILNLAAELGRPVAINLSQGDNVGPHDGTSLLEVGMANLIVGPGRVLVKSAGNEGQLSRHAEGVLATGAQHHVQIGVPAGFAQVVIDIWYPGADRIDLRITPPGGITSAPVAPPSTTTLALSNGNDAFVDADLHDPGNHDNRTFVILQRGSSLTVAAGNWTLSLTGTMVLDGRWHAWIQRNSRARFLAPFMSRASTISIPGTSRGVITAGSYVSNGAATGSPNGSLSEFSSRGPTRDGRRAPTVAAPGEELTAPQPPSPPGGFGPMSGTSMAAPMITGTAALMLEQRPTATAADVRQCLEQTARLDASTGMAPSNDWGAGKLDAEAACGCI